MLKEGAFINRKIRIILFCQIFGWIVCIAGGLADSLVAGIFLDSEAVSAVGIVQPIYSTIVFISALLSQGISIMYSQELGALHVDRSRKIAGMGVLISLVAGILLALLLIAIKKGILGFYACSDSITAYASTYYDAFIIIALIYPVYANLYTLINFDGDATTALMADVAIAIVNITVSILLVKSRGIQGLAIGTLVSIIVGLLVVLTHFLKKSNSIHFKLHFAWEDFRRNIKLSSASSLNYLYATIVSLVFNKFIIIQFSDAYLPAYTVISTNVSFQGMLVAAMNAGIIFISVAFGENNPSSIKRTLSILWKYGAVLIAVDTIVLLGLSQLWPSIYGITDPAIAAEAVFAAKAIALSSIFVCIVNSLAVYYPVINRIIEGNALIAVYLLIGPILIGIPFGMKLGFKAVAMGFAISPLLAIAILFIVVCFKKDLSKVPFLLEDSDEREFHADIRVELENILILRDKIGAFLEDNEVNRKLIIKVKMIVEDTLVHIMNKNKRNIICECTVLVNENHVRLITKDNGIIFNIMQEADDATDFRCYVLGTLIGDIDENTNTTTITYNKNTYVWER